MTWDIVWDKQMGGRCYTEYIASSIRNTMGQYWLNDYVDMLECLAQ